MRSDKTTNKMIVLVMVMAALGAAENIFAQPSKGFSPPGAGGSPNPFVPKGGDDDFNDEDDFLDDEVDDISDDILRQRMEQRLRERSGGPPAADPSLKPSPSPPPREHSNSNAPGNAIDIRDTSSAIGATSMSGGANTRITPGTKGPECLKLDPDTGYGPDVVTNFDFPDADIVEIAKTLGRLTCLNFMFDKDVRGKISIISNAPITVGDAWKSFLTALDMNGFSLIPSGKYFRIARQRDAKDKQIKTYSGSASPDNDMYITRVVPLKYINAEEVSRVFRNFMPPNTRIISYDQTNTLIVTDTGSNIKKIDDMLKVLDVESYDEKLEVIRIQNASAQEIAKLIDQLLPGSPGGGSPSGVPGFRGAGGGRFAQRRTKEGGVISHIIPDDRTNSVIVSANAKGLEQVKALIDHLDRKMNVAAGGRRIHVIYLQFADAEQVGNTLNSLVSGQSGRPSGAPVTPGGGGGGAVQLFEGNIRIAPDKPTNSLVITASPSDFQTIARVVKKLDVARDQVYVEAVILEMTVDRSFTFGASVASPANGLGFLPNDDLGKFIMNPLSLNGLVMGFQSGKSHTLSVPGGTGTAGTVTISSIQGLIRALQTNSNANILSTPQILTLDNQEATIEVAEQIPVPQVTTVQGAGTQTGISREKVSLSLTIKPQINKISNFVKLDINQKLEDISNRTPPKAVADLAFGTLSRSSKTTVVVQDGDTVALGGLVRDKVIENVSKVPLLGDIPLIGWLFRSKSTNSQKQNLISFITPRVIKHYQQIRSVLDRKIRERDEFIEKNGGGEDEFQDYKMRMIKELPPLSELKEGGRVENAELDGTEPEHEKPNEKTEKKSEKKSEEKSDPVSAIKKPESGTWISDDAE